MSGVSPPNPDLAQLATLLGVENVRLLVGTFLREYPVLLHDLTHGDRKTRHRVAHSLKSNTRIVGAHALSARMAAIENRLSRDTEPDLDAHELTTILSEFDAFAKALRSFVGQP